MINIFERCVIWAKEERLSSRLNACTVPDLSVICRNASDYVKSLELSATPGNYLYVKSGKEPVLYSSVFAALFKHLVGDIEDMNDTQKRTWADHLCSFQCDDGLFRDPALLNEIAETEDWWGWRHLTLLTLMALTSVEAKPSRPLAYLDAVSTRAKVRKWMETLDWGDRISFTSNTVQNYCAAMQYARDFLREDALDDSIHEILTILAEKCDPSTGLWGRNISDPDLMLSHGIQAGYHFWLLFWYEGLEIPNSTKVFDSILRLQNRWGGFNLKSYNSSACEDIDAIDPIIRLAFRHPELRETAASIVSKSLKWIYFNFNPDGGAVFQRDVSFIYGHKLMFSGKNESSIFATWFRSLSLAYCSELLNVIDKDSMKFEFRFLTCPGYQFSPRHKMK